MLYMSCRFIFLAKVFPAIDFTLKWKRSTKLHAHSTYDLNSLEKIRQHFFSLLLNFELHRFIDLIWFFYCTFWPFHSLVSSSLHTKATGWACSFVLYVVLFRIYFFFMSFHFVRWRFYTAKVYTEWKICSHVTITHRISALMAFQWFNKN